jgi:hypothetical protein
MITPLFHAKGDKLTNFDQSPIKGGTRPETRRHRRGLGGPMAPLPFFRNAHRSLALHRRQIFNDQSSQKFLKRVGASSV